MNSPADNLDWAHRVIRKFDPDFRFIWERYHEEILKILGPKIVWLDVGGGENAHVSEFGSRAAFSSGVDMRPPRQKSLSPFAVGALPSLPFRSASVDLVTLHFVAEHLRGMPGHFAEISRVLKPGGKLVIVTTNAWSPYIGAARCLPYAAKNFLIRALYRVDEDDVFPTYHEFNTPKKFRDRRLHAPMHLIRMDFLQDANFTRKWLFLVFFAGHLLTRGKLGFLRTNILGVFEKTP